MLRISRLTDYGTVIMAYLASNRDASHNARDAAKHTHISQPTVSKLLKKLTRAGLLQAQRGTKGGYLLAMPPENISLAQIIHAMEGGEIALTNCSHSKNTCSVETLCALQSNWRTLTEALRETLSQITLAEMIKPLPKERAQEYLNLKKIPVTQV